MEQKLDWYLEKHHSEHFTNFLNKTVKANNLPLDQYGPPNVRFEVSVFPTEDNTYSPDDNHNKLRLLFLAHGKEGDLSTPPGPTLWAELLNVKTGDLTCVPITEFCDLHPHVDALGTYAKTFVDFIPPVELLALDSRYFLAAGYSRWYINTFYPWEWTDQDKLLYWEEWQEDTTEAIEDDHPKGFSRAKSEDLTEDVNPAEGPYITTWINNITQEKIKQHNHVEDRTAYFWPHPGNFQEEVEDELVWLDDDQE